MPIQASAPFDNPVADTIIRSRDGVIFRVRSGIVAEASPIFADMFTLPLPDSTSIPDSSDFMDGKPVVAIEEDSVTIDRLLRLCYPVADPELSTLEDVRPVLAAALKYEMDEAISLMKRALLSFLDRQPLDVWTFACVLGLESEARTAATKLIDTEIPLEAPAVLEEVTAGMYFRLIKFLRLSGQVSEKFTFAGPDPEDAPTPKQQYTAPTKIVYETRPFADIICRTSDREDFHTHKIILCAASPVLLERVLALSSSEVSSSSSLSVLDVDIPGELFGSLLELCYPVTHAHLGYLPVNQALSMLRCAQQFRMDELSRVLRVMAVGSSKASHPLATYLLASKYGLLDIADDALSFLYADPFTYGCIPEMEVTPAPPYHRLVVNRQQTFAIASEIVTAITARPAVVDATSGDNPSDSSIDTLAILSNVDIPLSGDPWLKGILEETKKNLRASDKRSWWGRPNTSKTLKESVERKLWCTSCDENVRHILAIEKLHDEVRKAMDKNNRKLKKRWF